MTLSVYRNLVSIASKELSAKEFQIYLYILNRYIDNQMVEFQITQQNMAEELGIHRVFVAKTLKKLRDIGMIRGVGACRKLGISYSVDIFG